MMVHDCEFPEVELLETDEDAEGNLRAGMKVLTPCPECGETPLDHMDWLHKLNEEFGRALTQAKPQMPLYHWSPRSRRKQIVRWGLRPFMRTTTATTADTHTYPVICLADTPSWAWALSGGMKWTPDGEWDLWQTQLDRLVDPVILPSDQRLSGVYEVRTEHRIYKRDVWYVASRFQPPRSSAGRRQKP